MVEVPAAMGVLAGLPVRAVWFAPVGTTLPEGVGDWLDPAFKLTLPEPPPVEVVRVEEFAVPSHNESGILGTALAVVVDFGAGEVEAARVVFPEVLLRHGAERFKVLFLLSEELARRRPETAG